MSATPEKAQEFINYCRQYIKGDEKGEAQIFLDRFFQVFGHQGALQAGAIFEERINHGSKTGHTGFADLLWKNRVLIEMKKRNSDLNNREYRTQAERYYIRIKKSDRPRYVILCNFDQFHIYDFDNQPDIPVDIILLENLSKRLPAFAFMESKNIPPIFQNNQVEITEKAARRLGDVLHSLLERGEKNNYQKYSIFQAQKFILQCVLAMYAEDIGLLPPAIFTRCVQECLQDNANSYDVIGGLFKVMNEQGITPDGKYEGVNYFNGGLFTEIHPIKLELGELRLLQVCCEQNWSKVRPSIFGNLFEGALKYTDKSKAKQQKQRHIHGVHFTSESDIRSIVIPTIRDYWELRIDHSNTPEELQNLHEELVNYKVLDPACGSGNFLYVAYQELKYIEQVLLDKLDTEQPSPPNPLSHRRGGISSPLAPLPQERGMIKKVSPQQFYGMDINSFAVELAKVTLMIGRKVAIEQLGLNESSLPLDQLDSNIICTDALFTNWINADAIIGNPPFLGSRNIRLTLGDEYSDRLFAKYPKNVDFCSYWFKLAHDNINDNGRVGLVATNSISQNQSRAVSLDYILANNGYIYNAISTQEWSGDAAVYVSIINWCKTQPKHYILDGKEVTNINSSLTTIIDVTKAQTLKVNLNQCFQGIIPNGKDFYITEEKAQEWINKDEKNKDVLKLSISADNLTTNYDVKPSRWIIDFNDMSLEDASNYQLPFEHIKINVKPERDKNKDKKTREDWWLFPRNRPAMRDKIKDLSCYFIIPRVSKWFIFLPVDVKYLPNDSTVIVSSEDFYILGILTSNLHRLWIKAQCSTLGETIRYTNTTCFETFPFSQNSPQKIVENIRKLMLELHEYRSKEMEKKGWGITQLYNQYYHEPASKLYQFHQKLDELVLKAYNFLPDDNILEKLFELNQELGEKEQKGEKVRRINF